MKNIEEKIIKINEVAKTFADKMSSEIISALKDKKIILCGPGCNPNCKNDNGYHESGCWFKRRLAWQYKLIEDLEVIPIIMDTIFDKRLPITDPEIKMCKESDAIVLFPGRPGVQREFEVFRKEEDLKKKLLIFVPEEYHPYASFETSTGPFGEAINQFKIRHRGLVFSYKTDDSDGSPTIYENMKRILIDFFTLPDN